MFDEVKPHVAKYEYFQAGYVNQPNDFDGLDLGGSMPIASNVAVTGRLTLPSSSVNGVTVDSRRLELGTRYFFEMPSLEQTDADLGIAFANVDVEGGTVSDSSSSLLLSGQLRRSMYRQLGNSKYAINEAYGGAQVAADDLGAAALHAGLLIDLTRKVAANAEVMYDDGAHLRLGLRMDLAKPGAPRRAALMKKKPAEDAASEMQPETGALESEAGEKKNPVASFFRKLFRQGPDAEPAANTEDAVAAEEIVPVAKPLIVKESGPDLPGER